MDDNIKRIIAQAIKNILGRVGSQHSIIKLEEKHVKKIHFIPRRYRVFGGMLQSMNIQFGNFIEELMTLIIESDGRYEIVSRLSGKKNNRFRISQTASSMIDKYIDDCQMSSDGFCNKAFPILQDAIILDDDNMVYEVKHDIDLLFKNVDSGKYYYLEIKYNDDHDTGKFVDINRKFIKTYAYLVNELTINDIDELTPILFFFNNKKMKGNPYIPESKNIRRGKNFFDEFIKNISYSELNDYMENLSESDEVKRMFDKLYNKVVMSERDTTHLLKE